MSLVYSQRTGILYADGNYIGQGYSGCGVGLNNPALQSIHDVGPIPVGQWGIIGPPQESAAHGPYVLRLTPLSATVTHGRTDFLIHGDSRAFPGKKMASTGCIVLDPDLRKFVWESGVRTLTVVEEVVDTERTPPDGTVYPKDEGEEV